MPSADLTGGTILGEFTDPVPPGEFAEILIKGEGLEPGDYQIELIAYGAYSFSELGAAPIPVVIPEVCLR